MTRILNFPTKSLTSSTHQLLALFVLLVLASISRAEEAIDYREQIRPLLSDRCYACHGPDENTRKAKLRLDEEAAAKAPRRAGLLAIAPGEPDKSEILRRITSKDPDEVMPPPESKLPRLTDDEADLLRRWIKQGAPWQAHWSFVAPEDIQPPDVKQEDWPRTPIDRFVLAKLESLGITPAAQADKTKLIRRVTFDLTGLPPTVEEVNAFVNDTSPDAYEKLVDRLLASERYGEHMAVDWLDAARYADSYGYQIDRDRSVWPWRDWVIKALNENLPYDKFITWQLAGDLLPNATDEQILATAFNRLHPQKAEGGSTELEFRTEYIADRVNTLGAAFMGLTLECSRCHDHKYDPITQREYYQFYAFFSGIDEFGLYAYFTSSTPTPTLMLVEDDAKQNIETAKQAILDAEATWERERDTREDAFNAWLAQRSAERAGEPTIPDRIAHFPLDAITEGKLDNTHDTEAPANTPDANTIVPGVVDKALKLTGDDAVTTNIGNFTRNQAFSISTWIQTPDVKDRAVVFHRSPAWTDAGSRGYELLIEEGHLSAALVHFWPGNAIRIRLTEPLPVGQWVHIALTYDGSSRAEGLRVYVDGREPGREIVRDNLYKQITGGGRNGDHITIGARFRDRGFTDGLVDDFQVYTRALTPLEVAQLHDGQSLSIALATPVNDLSSDMRHALFAYYLSTVDPVAQSARENLAALRTERSKLVDGTREIMVMRDMDNPPPTHLLLRGAYDAPGPIVERATPPWLSPYGDDLPRNRLGLARWLTREDHPLTARVAVNRLWQAAFGRGLVRTPEDFGAQGELPTHPALLDYLARDFIKSGWNVKAFMKQMVMSATYRQSSVVDGEIRKRDPENRLLARGPRYRLSAEMIRDQALATSGLLVEKIGGPPAKPYEVAVSFKPVDPDKGEGLYRRSVYTYVKRTGPAPVMAAFDAAKRDVCVVKRERTSTPAQSLVLLNGPQFVEAARAIGQRALQSNGDDVTGTLTNIFQTLTSREPEPDELRILKTLYDEQLSYFGDHPEQTEAFLSIGESERDAQMDPSRLAAMTIVAQALMNHDESLIKQ